MRPRIRVVWAVLASLSALACAPAPAPRPTTLPAAPVAGLPRRVRVHVDHVARAHAGEFEAARRELLGAFAAHGVSEGTTFVLETDEPAYLSLRPFDRYADLDAAGALQKTVDDAVGEATLARLDAVTHATLVPPHRNELWSLQAALLYLPPGGPTFATAKAGRLVEDEVMPERSDAYEEAVTGESRALADARFPVSRVVYISAYGSGRVITLWLAARREDLDLALPQPAGELETKARATAAEETVRAFVVREDLGSR